MPTAPHPIHIQRPCFPFSFFFFSSTSFSFPFRLSGLILLLLPITRFRFDFQVINPTNGKLITKISEGTPKGRSCLHFPSPIMMLPLYSPSFLISLKFLCSDVDAAVDAAQKAFDTTWGREFRSVSSSIYPLFAFWSLSLKLFFSSLLIQSCVHTPELRSLSTYGADQTTRILYPFPV